MMNGKRFSFKAQGLIDKTSKAHFKSLEHS